jgi:hypothetical protein
MPERIAVMLSVRERDGDMVFVAQPVVGTTAIEGARGLVALLLWREDARTIRIRLCNCASGTVAYAQSGAMLLTLAEELGFVRAR